jgi:hypothetical protein
MLQRGRQNVVARYCGEAGSGLQLAVAAMASNAATRGDGRQRVAALANVALQRFCFFFFFVLLDNFKSERERHEEKGRESLWNLFKDLHFVGWQECNTQAPANSLQYQRKLPRVTATHQHPPAPATVAPTIATATITQELTSERNLWLST